MLSFVADFKTLLPVIVAFVPVHMYTLKFGEKNNFLSFF